MGRHRSRSRSPRRRSRSPPRRKRYDDPRDRRSCPSGLLVRNVALDATTDDLRIPFERFGPVKDVYLPKNYYTGEPRGFAFVKFRYADDAAAAKQQLNHQVIGGREISIVYAEENRKTPHEMRRTARISDRYSGGSHRRRYSSRSPKRRHRSYSPSPTPDRRKSRDYDRNARDAYHSRRSVSHSPRRSVSRTPPSLHDVSRSPPRAASRSPPRGASRSPPHGASRSPPRATSPSPPRSVSRSPPVDLKVKKQYQSFNDNGQSPPRSQSYSE